MSQPHDQHIPPAADTATTSFDLAQTVAEVWRSIVEPERLAAWMGQGSTIEPWTSGELHLADIATGVPKRGRVGAVVPEHSIDFVWWPEDDPGQAGHVSFTLTPIEAGTRVTVVETAASAGNHQVLALAGASCWRLALLSVAATMVSVGIGR
jgi:uncharacterized protein YndB with AHSA1/START domain